MEKNLKKEMGAISSAHRNKRKYNKKSLVDDFSEEKKDYTEKVFDTLKAVAIESFYFNCKGFGMIHFKSGTVIDNQGIVAAMLEANSPIELI